MNNNSNNCGGCGTTCSECGRPWSICKQDGGCGCNKCKDIKFCEYGRMANGCIREKQPGCPMQAVIPSVTVESIEGIKNLADCLVHVSDINTTFYIDDKHRPIITWAGPIDIPGYDMEGNPNNYRDQIVTDVANQIAVIYDKSGNGYMFGLAENMDLQEQVNNKLDAMAEDGTLQNLIYQAINCPQGMTLDARRIGRKLFYSGTGGDASPFNMQGGCRIDDTYVAYALWDSLNKYPVSNRICVMNINTGEIVRYADYSYGWCNSMTYYDGKLYIAERGKEIDGEGHYENNGVIKVLNADTLALVDTITMDFNVNALYQYGGKFYILQEGGNTIYKYDSTLTTLEDTITLDIDYVNYHQTICIDSQYIYLLSTQPSNALNIFDVETGERIRSYNIPKYGGLYRIGELQWIDKVNDDGDIIIGTDVITSNENIAQFFALNYKKNVDTKYFNAIYALTLYCNSDTDNYDADGTNTKPFKSLNEAVNTVISNIVVQGNNKTYPYVYASDIHLARFVNCTFNGGIMAQYGDYEFSNCTFKKLTQRDESACVYVRRSNIHFSDSSFDGTDCDYCIYDNGECTYKFKSTTFSAYNTSVFYGNLPSSVVNLNRSLDMPYIPRAYGARFKLFDTDTTIKTADSYEYDTTLTEDEIYYLIHNASHMIIQMENFNKNNVQEFVFVNKLKGTTTTSATYTITDEVIAGTAISQKIGKMIFVISASGITVNSNVTDQNSNGTFTRMTGTADNDYLKIKNIIFSDL